MRSGCQTPKPAHHGATCRAGYTLLEMLAVMSAGTMIAVTAAVLIATLMSAEGRGIDAFVTQTTLTRLGRALRADAHQAATVEPLADAAAGESGVVFTRPDGTQLTWRTGVHGVQRQAVSTGRPPQRERFRLDGETRIEIGTDAGLVTVVHLRPRDSVTEAASTAFRGADEFRIEAAIGRDLPLELQAGATADALTARGG
jgi:hypothetical protein